MSTRILFTYTFQGGAALDVPTGCWVQGTAYLTYYNATNVISPDIMQRIRQAAGETLILPINYAGKYTIKDLDELLGAGGRYGKYWYVSVTNGRAICAYVDTDSSLNISTSNSLKSTFKSSGPTVWQPPYVIAAGANECMAGIHASHYRGQTWWEQAQRIKGKYVAHSGPMMYSTSNSGGAAVDWNAPQEVQTGKSQPGMSTQSYGSGVLGQTTQSLLPGPDGRTWCYSGGAVANTDDGIGDDWGDKTPPGPTISPYAAPGNSVLGSPYYPRNPACQSKSIAQVARKTYNSNPVMGCSDMVRTDDGTLYQLLFTSTYSRRVPAVQQGTAYDPERGAQQDSTPPVNAILNDPPGKDTIALHYSVAVPQDNNKIQYVRFTWLNQLFPHKPILGVLDNKTKPTKITFSIPKWPEIDPFIRNADPFNPTHDPYYGITAFEESYVHCNFTYNTPKSFYYHIGRIYDSKGGPNKASLGDIPPEINLPKQASGNTHGFSYPIEGRGEYGFQPKPFPYLDKTNRLQLNHHREVDVDTGRSGDVTFDIEMIGDPGAMSWKDCYLTVYPLRRVNYNYQSYVQSAQSTNVGHLRLPTNNTATVQDTEFWGETSHSNLDFGSSGPNNPFLDELNTQQGQTYNFDLLHIPGEYANGQPMRFYMALLDQWVQFSYNLPKPDFFLVRSRDSGASWEFCNNAQPITQLSALRDFNNTATAVNTNTTALIPSLVASENNVYIVWIFGGKGQNGASGETNPVKTLGSQDGGETWVEGHSFGPKPPR